MSKIKVDKMGLPCMTDEEISKMSLNPYDQLFIARLFSREDDYIAEILTEHFDKVTKVIEAQSRDIKEIRESIIKINERIDIIEERLDEDNVRISLLEKYASWQNTLFRMLFAAAFGIMIAEIIFFILHKTI